MFSHLSKPIRVVLGWQVVATVLIALATGLLAGGDGAISALAGGLISICAGLAAAVVASRSDASSAGGILGRALAGEAVKVVLAFLLLWLLLANYRDAVVGVVIGSFVVTMLIFAMAFFVRDY